jgi:hypothetical protein
MGMTIDDCIKELLINKEDDTYVLGNETIDFAIDTMHKYQKIEDIVRDYYNEQYTDKLDIEIIEMISEVLEEDGRWED